MMANLNEKDMSRDGMILTIAKQARLASTALQSVTTAQKNEALHMIATVLNERREEIFAANIADKEQAQIQVANGNLSASLFSRLDITKGDKFDTIVQGVKDIADNLDDPTGKVTLATKLDEDLELYRISCPVGVLLTIFEARPEVVVNISALALKSGNSAILKGGKEAQLTNNILAEVIRDALARFSSSSIPQDAIQIVESREDIDKLLDMDRYIDLVVPRGSNSLVKYIQNHTRIPVLGHADGLCTIYVDEHADLQKSIRVVTDSKINYPAACNSAETLLIHAHVLQSHLPAIAESLIQNSVTLRADPQSYAFLQQRLPFHTSQILQSTPQDYDTEFLNLVMAVKVVSNLDEAIEHINEHGSKHTDCIVTESKEAADWFMNRVDAAGVYWNASTRFADGFRYGFGAEVGVSTNKTHARGPVGLEGLIIYKYKIFGNGHIVAEFGSGKERKFLHKPIRAEEYKV